MAFGLPSVSYQTGDEIEEKVCRAAVAGVLNPGDILELVNDDPDDETFTSQQLVFENDQSVFHAFANRRDQLQSPCKELFKERFG